MTKSKNLVFFGTEDFSLYSLKLLVEKGWNIELVVTKPDSPKGRGRILSPPAVKQFAVENSIPVIQPTSTKELIKSLVKVTSSLGVLSAYGKIIPKEVLKKFKSGIVNIHPSLLPAYRGPSPIEQAILSGDKVTGVSLMKLVPEMDAGPVYAQEHIRLHGNETADSLYQSLGALGADLLVKNLTKITSGKLTPKDQDEKQATYTHMITKQDGVVDWTKSGQEIERQIRAYKSWPGSRTKLGEKEIVITDAYFEPTTSVASSEVGKLEIERDHSVDSYSITIKCSDGKIHITRLKPVGKREMSTKEFLAGNSIST